MKNVNKDEKHSTDIYELKANSQIRIHTGDSTKLGTNTKIYK